MWEYLKNAKKPIVLYGMGNGADKILDIAYQRGIKISGVFASDGFVRGHKFRDFDVISYSAAKEKFGDMIVLLCFGTQRSDVIELIKNVASENELYAPDVPVIGNGLFDNEYYSYNKDKFNNLYNILADKRSKCVLDSLIKYRLSGKIEYLFECQSDISEAYENIIRPSKDDIYVDLGAYNGDTVHEFLSYSGGYKKIFAVEPDRKNFKKLIKSTENLDNCVCINAPIHSEGALVKMDMRAGRNSKINSGEDTVLAVTLDGILNGEKADFIKMDVEGNEENAIKGAENTIAKYKPKMLISCYHRTEDYLKIPEQILAIRPDYKVFMRHYPYIPAWDTSFYFV